MAGRNVALGVRPGHSSKSGGLTPPSPPAEKTTAREDQTGQSGTCDGDHPYRPTHTLLCIYKSSRQASNLPCGMWQTGYTVRQCGSG